MTSLFIERWTALTDPQTTPEERAGNYIILTSHLKDPTIAVEFHQALCLTSKKLTEIILGDITCTSCDHAALQVLGYCLYIPAFSDKLTPQLVTAIIDGLCSVIQNRETDKSVCTRALWCLANQRLNLDNHVTLIVGVVTDLVTSQRYATPTVDCEALNVLIRISQQCPDKFLPLSPTWYQAILQLLFYGVSQLHTKALSFAVSMELYLVCNQELINWLIKELKKKVISKMLTQLSVRGQDNCHVLKAWSHVITILGTSLHKHGSFLNEMLRVVETGFKHRSMLVQEAAYKAWKALVSNFAQDLEILTSQKRLKLLLMPLLASAVRDKHEQVEHARIDTFSHLIGCLGNDKKALFKQVCVPFLLLCLGLDPKSDVTNIVFQFYSTQPVTTRDVIATPEGIPPHSKNGNDVIATPKNNIAGPNTSTPSFVGLSVTPTPLRGAESANRTTLSGNNEACPVAEGEEPQRSMGSVNMDKGVVYRVGSILSLVRSAQSKTKHRDHYLNDPSVPMVMTGCHALLQFIGVSAEVPESLIKSDPSRYIAFPKFLVPLDIAEIFALFLDCVLYHSSLFSTPERGATLETVVHHLISLLICCIDSEQAPPWTKPSDLNVAVGLFDILVQLVESSCLDNVLCKQMKMDILSQLCSIPAQFSVAIGNEYWKRFLAILFGYCKSEQLSDWFSSTFHKILKVVTTKLVNSDPLVNLMYLINQLDQFAKEGGAEKAYLSFMWLLISRAFSTYVIETNHISVGTTLDPDFTVVGLILKFPFLYLIPNSNQSTENEVMEQWKMTFRLSALHSSLLVKDPNTCAQLVLKELYSAYGHIVRTDPMELKTSVTKFDHFQNAMATAVQYVTTRLSWESLRGVSDKCLQTLFSLLGWQLVTVCDSRKKSTPLLCQLTSPIILMETIATVYHRLPSGSLVVAATDMVAQPLATIWKNIIQGDNMTLTKSRQKQQNELLDHVINTWKSILTAFQSRYTGKFDNSILSCLSPLFMVTLTSKTPAIVDTSLTFWCQLFDKSPTPLTYPPKLKEAFLNHLKSNPSLKLRLPGLDREFPHSDAGTATVTIVDDSGPSIHTPPRPVSTIHRHSNMSPSHYGNTSPRPSGDKSPIVHPMTSPRKGVRGSFLNRSAPSSPFRAHQVSPLAPATALDKVLARSVGSVGVESRSHDESINTKNSSVRRKLTLNRQDEEKYVSVDPPTKKRRLLTEHQKEKMKEPTILPAMYNTLDLTQDSNLPLTETQSVPMEDDPAISHGPMPPVLLPTTNTSADSAINGAPPIESADSAIKAAPPIATTTCSSEKYLQTTVINPLVPEKNKEKINPSVTSTLRVNNSSVLCTVLERTPPLATTGIVTQAPSPQVILPSTTCPSNSNAHAQSVIPSSNQGTKSTSLTLKKRGRSTGRKYLPKERSVPTSTATMTTGSALSLKSTKGESVTVKIVEGQTRCVGDSLGDSTTPKMVEIHDKNILVANRTMQTHPTDVDPGSGVVLKTTLVTVGDQSKSVISTDKSKSSVSTDKSKSAISTDKSKSSISTDKSKSSISTDKSKSSISTNASKSSISTDKSKSSISTNASKSSISTDQSKSSISTDQSKSSLSTDKSKSSISTDQSKSSISTDKSKSSISTNASKSSISTDKSKSSISTNASKSSISTDQSKSSISTDQSKSSLSTDKSKSSISTDKSISTERKSGQSSFVPVVQSSSRVDHDVIDLTESSDTPQVDVIAHPSSSTARTPVSDVPSIKPNSSMSTVQLSGLYSSKELTGVNVGVAKGCGQACGDNKKTVVGPAGLSEQRIKGLNMMIKELTSMIEISKNEITIRQKVEVSKEERKNSCKVEISKEERKKKDSLPRVTKDNTKKQNTADDKRQVSVGNRVDKSSVPSAMDVSPTHEQTLQDKTFLSVVEDPLEGVKSKETVKLDMTLSKSEGESTTMSATTPVHHGQTDDGCHTNHTGILKHVSQFDTPSTAKSERRVQFAREHVVHVPAKTEGSYKTPTHSRSSRTPQGVFSSRRTLLMSQTPPRMIAVSKPPQTPPSCDPIYPSLSDCPSPIEQILPSLTASKFTHGLVQLVRARNINTVGNISSLSEQQVQTLPIKSPKVINLRNALRSFEQVLGSKRRASVDCDSPLLPPSKVAKLNSDLSDNTRKTETSSSKHTPSLEAKVLSNTERQLENGVPDDSVFEDSNDITPTLPHAMSLDLSTPDSQMVVCGEGSANIDHTTAPTLPHAMSLDLSTPDSQMVVCGEDTANIDHTTANLTGRSFSSGVSDVIKDDEMRTKNVSTTPQQSSSHEELTNTVERMETDNDTSTSSKVVGHTSTTTNNTSTLLAQTVSSTRDCTSSRIHIPAPILHDHLYCSQEPPKPSVISPSGTLKSLLNLPQQHTTSSSETLSGGEDKLAINLVPSSKKEDGKNQDCEMSDVSTGTNLPDSDVLSDGRDTGDGRNKPTFSTFGTFDHTYCKVGVVLGSSGETSKDQILSSESQELFSCHGLSQAESEQTETPPTTSLALPTSRSAEFEQTETPPTVSLAPSTSRSAESEQTETPPTISLAPPTSRSAETNIVASTSSETANHETSNNVATSTEISHVPSIDDHPLANTTTNIEALDTSSGTGRVQQLSEGSSTSAFSETELTLLKGLLGARPEQLETLGVCELVELIALSNQFSHRLATFLKHKI